MRHLTTSAAALIMSATPVFAADLPVAPEPVDYVQICDAYGNGYYFIPGTDTCLRIRGRVRAEYRFNDFGDEPSNWTDRLLNDTSTRARGYLRMDARTQTEYGLLRAYIDMFATIDSGSPTSISSLPDGVDEGYSSDPSTSFTLDYAFVQFGGMTVGKTHSFYDFWTGYAYGAINTVAYSDQTLWLAGYTFDLGNGLSASVSVEDATYRRQSLISEDLDSLTTIGYGGHRAPDLVGNLRLDQGWGSAQLMAAVHEVRYAESYPSGKAGWAIGAGVEVNLPFLTNTQFALMGNYAQGALGYVHSDWNDRMYDAGEVEGGNDGLADGWSIATGIYTELTPEWNFALQGSYADADQELVYDIAQWDVVGKVGWTPVHGFEIGGEVAYRNLNYDEDAASLITETPDDTDIVTALIRVQRDF
ncbi:porin [Polycladidibacter hongkongensis]|uniref:porin n=1 Tax=Polycladidibacter hongkongensis TaxID=1647556 RepID=UPI00082B9F82|nr:porin [Pseudovibrio hongkongensis]